MWITTLLSLPYDYRLGTPKFRHGYSFVARIHCVLGKLESTHGPLFLFLFSCSLFSSSRDTRTAWNGCIGRLFGKLTTCFQPGKEFLRRCMGNQVGFFDSFVIKVGYQPEHKLSGKSLIIVAYTFQLYQKAFPQKCLTGGYNAIENPANIWASPHNNTACCVLICIHQRYIRPSIRPWNKVDLFHLML